MIVWILSCIFIFILDVLSKCMYGHFFSSYELMVLICLFSIYLNTVDRSMGIQNTRNLGVTEVTSKDYDKKKRNKLLLLLG